jgi:hypothetical protein
LQSLSESASVPVDVSIEFGKGHGQMADVLLRIIEELPVVYSTSFG